MATKVEKRRVRKEREAKELGIELKDNKTTKQLQKEEEEKKSFYKSELNKWAWFTLEIFLLWFIFTFGPKAFGNLMG